MPRNFAELKSEGTIPMLSPAEKLGDASPVTHRSTPVAPRKTPDPVYSPNPGYLVKWAVLKEIYLKCANHVVRKQHIHMPEQWHHAELVMWIRSGGGLRKRLSYKDPLTAHTEIFNMDSCGQIIWEGYILRNIQKRVLRPTRLNDLQEPSVDELRQGIGLSRRSDTRLLKVRANAHG